MINSLTTQKVGPVTWQLPRVRSRVTMQTCEHPTLANHAPHSFYPSILHQGDGFPLSNGYPGHWMSIFEFSPPPLWPQEPSRLRVQSTSMSDLPFSDCFY